MCYSLLASLEFVHDLHAILIAFDDPPLPAFKNQAQNISHWRELAQ
jgi:hypothetical protein